MSTDVRPATDAGTLRATLSGIRQWTLRALFGDHLGFTLFCGTLFVLGLTMRQGVFINDNYTVANALVAVADGHLDLRRAAFGQSLATPGAVESGGRVYGRNYGHVFLALPVLLVLRGLSAVADLRLLFAGGWALLALWTIRGIGASLDRERFGAFLGSGLALLLFGGSIAAATRLPASKLPFLALQLVSVIAAGFVAVLCYRLVRSAHGRHMGSAAGIAAVLGTGAGFWGTIPKRHVLVAFFAALSAYALYRSRVLASETGLGYADVRYRAGAYACVGITAWVAAPEGIILGLAVSTADLATANRADFALRPLLVVGVVTCLSFLPLLATNLAIAGNPLQPPRRLPGYSGSNLGNGGEAGVGSSSGSAGSDGGGGSSFGSGTVVGLILGQFIDGAVVVVTQPNHVFRTFVRSSYDTGAWSGANDTLGANLSVLESSPILGGIVGFAALGVRRLSKGFTEIGTRRDIRVVDIFAIAYAFLLTLAYMPRLPLHATVTVRYLVPMYPLLVYAVARLPAVQRAINHRWDWAAWTYAGTLLVGGQLFLAGTTLLELGVGESMQTHAVVNLGIAGLLAAWAVAATLATRRDDSDRYDEVGAILLGLTASAGTVLILLASITYFSGDFLLPLVPDL